MLRKAPNPQPECNRIAISLAQLAAGLVRRRGLIPPTAIDVAVTPGQGPERPLPRPWITGGLVFRRLNAVERSYCSDGPGRAQV